MQNPHLLVGTCGFPATTGEPRGCDRDLSGQSQGSLPGGLQQVCLLVQAAGGPWCPLSSLQGVLWGGLKATGPAVCSQPGPCRLAERGGWPSRGGAAGTHHWAGTRSRFCRNSGLACRRCCLVRSNPGEPEKVPVGTASGQAAFQAPQTRVFPGGGGVCSWPETSRHPEGCRRPHRPSLGPSPMGSALVSDPLLANVGQCWDVPPSVPGGSPGLPETHGCRGQWPAAQERRPLQPRGVGPQGEVPSASTVTTCEGEDAEAQRGRAPRDTWSCWPWGGGQEGSVPGGLQRCEGAGAATYRVVVAVPACVLHGPPVSEPGHPRLGREGRG